MISAESKDRESTREQSEPTQSALEDDSTEPVGEAARSQLPLLLLPQLLALSE